MIATLPPGAAKHQEDSPPVPARVGARTPGALRALFFAYFRPQLPLAFLMTLVPGVMLLVVQIQNHINAPRSEPAICVLLIDWVRVLTLLGCPVAGLGLGVLQSRPDSEEKNWGLMMHRPAGSWILFLGRVLAGLALYAIAAGLPLACCFIYAFFQKHVPYHWTFMLPGMADFLSGLVYYLAGVLIVMRSARIYGSRVAPLPAALACSIIMATVPRFWEAAGVIGIFLAIYVLAAHGACASNGYRLGGRVWGRLATAIVIFVALALIGFGGGLWIEARAYTEAQNARFEIRDRPEAQQEWRALQQRRPIVTQYILLPDASLGKQVYAAPARQETEKAGFDSFPYMTFFKVGPPDVPVKLTKEDLARVRQQTPYATTVLAPGSYRALGVIEGGAEFQSSPGGVQWWYLQPEGIFQAIDGKGVAIGSLGVNGFRAGRTGVTGFGTFQGSNSQLPTDLLNELGVFQVDLARHTVTERWAFPPGEKIMAIMEGKWDMQFAFSRSQMFIYKEGLLAGTVPLTHPATEYYIMLTRFPEQQRWALWFSHSVGAADEHVAWYDEKWNLISEVAIPDPRTVDFGADYPPAWLKQMEREIAAHYGTTLGWSEGLCCLPVIYAVRQISGLQRLYDLDGHFESEMPGFPDLVPVTDAVYRAALMLTLAAAALAMAGLAFAYRARWKWLWILSAAVFGPIMLLVLLATHARPRYVRCGGCGRRVDVGDAACRCGRGQTAYVPRGTEIFASIAGE